MFLLGVKDLENELCFILVLLNNIYISLSKLFDLKLYWFINIFKKMIILKIFMKFIFYNIM